MRTAYYSTLAALIFTAALLFSLMGKIWWLLMNREIDAAYDLSGYVTSGFLVFIIIIPMFAHSRAEGALKDQAK